MSFCIHVCAPAATYPYPNASQAGAATLRAFGRSPDALRGHTARVQGNLAARFAWNAANQWFLLCLEALGAGFVAAAAASTVLGAAVLGGGAAAAGLALSSAMRVPDLLLSLMRAGTTVEVRAGAW